MNVVGCCPLPVISILITFVCCSLIYEITFLEYDFNWLFALICVIKLCHFSMLGLAFIGKCRRVREQTYVQWVG